MNPLLLTNFYKVCHHQQYNENLEYITSYYTPRMSRLEDSNFVVVALIKSFIVKYIVDSFNSNFFERDKSEVLDEYFYTLVDTIGEEVATNANLKVKELHNLGYLPIEINALPEGTLSPIKVPILEIKNTHKKFAWLVNALESLISTSLWHGMVSATVGYQYRMIANEWYAKTSDVTEVNSALGDFSFRGQESVESAINSSAGFLYSHMNTASVASIPFLAHHYNVPIKSVGRGGVSTEHSVMCSNYSIDGDEITFLHKLITQIYKTGYLSIVLDSYDYWNAVDVLIPSLKEQILSRDGVIGVRGDSGDPVEIIAGTVDFFGAETFEEMGTVELLWKHFGGTVNSKGYKVLNKKIKVVYGDSITQNRAVKIFQRLEKKGFSSECVSLGVGSFSMQAFEDKNGNLFPYTRDTFGVAIKATHGLMADGKELFILKNPKTDKDNFKKSLQGLIDVREDENGVLYPVDKLTTSDTRDTKMVPYFKDGKILYNESLAKIRARLHNGNF